MSHERKKISEPVKITLLLLALVLLGLLVLLWRQYTYIQKRHLAQAQIVARIQQLAHRKDQENGTLTTTDTSYIQAWMTFDYINTAFDVSPDYLMTSLNIHSLQYPHISIAHYAHLNNINPNTLSSQTAQAVATYLSSSSPQRP